MIAIAPVSPIHISLDFSACMEAGISIAITSLFNLLVVTAEYSVVLLKARLNH